MEKTGMVLEGGGVRGIYTAGVLDFFLDKNVEVDAVFGVSAGSLHGVNYLSRQKKRSYRVATNYLNDKRYLSVHSLIRTGDIFGAEFCYRTIPDELDLYDYEAYCENKAKLYATVSNLETGQAEYIRCNDIKTDIEYVRASASLPLLSRTVEIHGKKYLDGGICDSIPLRAAQMMGYKRNIVILTRVSDYQKKPNKMMPVIRRKYRAYPQFVEAVKNRHVVYNETLKLIQEEEEKGNCFVIRPSQNLEVSRLEKDKSKIERLYELGIKDAKEQYEKLCNFLGQEPGK